MTRKELELGYDCKLIQTIWECLPTEVELVYVERQGDPWYGAPTVELEIDKDKAIEIIEFLKEAYGL